MFAIILIEYGSAFGQIPIIYSVEKIHEDTSYIGVYNYETQDYDVIFKLSPRVRTTNNCVTFDPYRKIIYYMNSTGPCGGPYYWNVYAIDLKNHGSTKKYVIEKEITILDLQYDFFSNCLVFRGDDSLRYYSVASPELKSVIKIPLSRKVLFSSKPEVYNMNYRTYLYYTELIDEDDYNLVFVNIDSNKYHTVSNTVQEWPLTLTTDLSTNQYFGVSRVSKDSSYIVNVNPNSGEFTQLCPMPSDYVGSINYELFDSYNSKYIASYYTSTTGNYKFTIYDINSGTIDTTRCRFTQSYLFIDYDPIPILKLRNDTLIGSISENYNWYLNDTLISVSNTHTHIPQISGYYKFSTTNFAGDTLFSNEIYVEIISSINNVDNGNYELFIYPNPVSNILNFRLNQSRRLLYQVYITSLEGKVIEEFFIKNNDLIQIDISDYANGIYIIKCTYNGKTLTRKVIKNTY